MSSLKPCPFRIVGVHKWERDKKVYDYEERFAECMGVRCPAFQIGTGVCIRSNGGPMYMTYEDEPENAAKMWLKLMKQKTQE